MTRRPTDPTPLILLAGFLGAGKTTLLRTLLPRLRSQGLQAHVILNDYQNAEIDGLPFHREEFDDLTGTLGGPLARDKAWFFASIQTTDDAYADPGVDPSFPTA